MGDDVSDLERIKEDYPAGKLFNDVAERWKGRQEWTYFMLMFDKLRDRNVPMNQKLTAVLELEDYFKTGVQTTESNEWEGAEDEDGDVEDEEEEEEEEEELGKHF